MLLLRNQTTAEMTNMPAAPRGRASWNERWRSPSSPHRQLNRSIPSEVPAQPPRPAGECWPAAAGTQFLSRWYEQTKRYPPLCRAKITHASPRMSSQAQMAAIAVRRSAAGDHAPAHTALQRTEADAGTSAKSRVTTHARNKRTAPNTTPIGARQAVEYSAENAFEAPRSCRNVSEFELRRFRDIV